MTTPYDLVQVLLLVIAACATGLVLVLPSRNTRPAVAIKTAAAVCAGLVWAAVVIWALVKV